MTEDQKREQYNKSIERAKWFLTEYAEMENMNMLFEKENIAAELIADIEVFIESLGYDMGNVNSIKIVSKDMIKQGKPL